MHPNLCSDNVFVSASLNIKIGGFFSHILSKKNTPKFRSASKKRSVNSNASAGIEHNIKSLARIFEELLMSAGDGDCKKNAVSSLISRMQNAHRQDEQPKIAEVSDIIDTMYMKLWNQSNIAVEKLPNSMFKMVWSNNSDAAPSPSVPLLLQPQDQRTNANDVVVKNHHSETAGTRAHHQQIVVKQSSKQQQSYRPTHQFRIINIITCLL